MLTPIEETGEKLGVYHLIKILQTRYCHFDQETNSYQLQTPSQGQIAHYMISQVRLPETGWFFFTLTLGVLTGSASNAFDLAVVTSCASRSGD
jgi:hypothetical protein